MFLNDLRGITFDQFVAYAFDRPVPAKGEANWWHESSDDFIQIIVDPLLQLAHARRLFTDPLFLRERFSDAQLENGFWFLCHVGNSDFSDFLPNLFWQTAVPLTARVETIQTMYDLFEKFFSRYPTELSTNMWWDLLADDLDIRRYAKDPSDIEPIRAAMVETLARILRLEARHCQEAALHGLNHIAHERQRFELIDAFLQTSRDDKLRKYALQCRAGRAQ